MTRILQRGKVDAIDLACPVVVCTGFETCRLPCIVKFSGLTGIFALCTAEKTVYIQDHCELKLMQVSFP